MHAWASLKYMYAYRSLHHISYYILHFHSFMVSVSPTRMHTVSPTLPHQCNSTNLMISTTPQTNNIHHTSTGGRTLANCKPTESYYVHTLVALGALQGLSLLLLAVVTIGWVCTCMSMKKREAKISTMTHIRYHKVTFLCACMSDKFMQIHQNGPLDKCMQILFIHSSALCIITYMT